MKFSHDIPAAARAFSRGRRCAGFTLAEVLAALLFIAIVIPVAVHGLQIASRAGEVAQRKASAARIAERVVNEITATHQFTTANQRGNAQENGTDFQYTTKIENWDQNLLRQLSVQVSFAVQGQTYFVRLATLVDMAQF